MGKVAIIGNARGGKTPLARKLGRRLGIKVHPVDLIRWKPNSRPTPLSEIKS